MPRIGNSQSARRLFQSLTALAILLLADTCAAQLDFSQTRRPVQPSSPRQAAEGMRPHPSIVRVIAEDGEAESHGSGTLIGVDAEHGYVLTNWHVVHQATGRVIVQFPDGFESAATVMKTDEIWDLALLVIWRPTADPMPLSPQPPQPQEPLTIAGYGQGPFRAAQGRFTDHASPSESAPFDMFEVSVAARQGDSGGPIVNQRGELAGVLFGTGDGMTTGTKVDRVRKFLDAAFQSDTIASSEFASLASPATSQPAVSEQQTAALRVDAVPQDPTVGFTSPSGPFPPSEGKMDSIDEFLASIPVASRTENDVRSDQGNVSIGDYVGSTPFDQAKTFLAAVGVFAIVLHLLPR